MIKKKVIDPFELWQDAVYIQQGVKNQKEAKQ